MQVDELPAVNPVVDYTQILPIQQKRTIAFVNHFIINTVSYLNKFAQSCESRFMEFEYKLQKVEASLLILEAQLSSIPGLDEPNNNATQNLNNDNNNSVSISNVTSIELPQITNIVEDEKEHDTTQVDIPKTGKTASEDPRFIKFFKMVHFGVPGQAVKLKMQNEGFDPNILDKPDEIIPDSSSNKT